MNQVTCPTCGARLKIAVAMQRQRVSCPRKFGLDIQVWSIETMGKLDPRSLSAQELRSLIERMKTIPKTNPDIECRNAADQAHAKLIGTGFLKKR